MLAYLDYTMENINREYKFQTSRGRNIEWETFYTCSPFKPSTPSSPGSPCGAEEEKLLKERGPGVHDYRFDVNILANIFF